MNPERRYQRAACLTVVLGITAYATAAGWVLLAIVAVPLVIGLWWVSSGHGARLLLPRWAVNLLLAGALAYAVYRTVTHGPDVEGVAELVVLLQLIKMGDRRAARDDGQILALAVFLAIAAMLTSNELWVGVQLIAFLPTLIGAVMLHQLHAGQEQAAGAVATAWRGYGRSTPARQSHTKPWPGRPARPRPVVGRRLVAHLRAVGVLALGCALASSVAIFVLMPRGIGEGEFGRWRTPLSREVTGFTETVRLGSGGVISQSQEVILDLRVRSAAGVNLGSPDQFYYLRGAVLDKYERGVWVREGAPGRGAGARGRDLSRLGVNTLRGEVQTGETVRFIEERAVALVEQVVKFRSLGAEGQPIFTLWRPSRIEFVTRGRAAVDRTARVGRVYPMGGAAEGFEYRAWSVLQPPPEPAGAPGPRPGTPDFPNDRVRDLAAQIARDAGLNPDPVTRPVRDDGRLAEAIERHVRDNYTYVLTEHASPAGVDPIEHFLFGTREGHCEYSASAMTALCRAVGINARMAVGYLAAEYNDAAEVYTVRASNAHAWVEAEIGADQWRRYDPTPAVELARIHRPRLGVLGRFRQWLDALEFAWNSRVVSFDERARERVIGGGADGQPGFLWRLDGVLQRIRRGGPALVRDAALSALAVFAVAAGLGALGVVVARRGLLRRPGAGRSPRTRRAARERKDPAQAARLAQAAFYQRLLETLARRGHPKPTHRPPLDHAAALTGIDPVLGEGTAALGRLYYRVRFGARSLSEPEREEAHAILTRLSNAPRTASTAADRRT